ncbi:ATP-binding protein PhnN [Vibrio variabilis]|uniref:Ribose 1,5-bisphosphate phosphokinase PhnN n=1 Tax=Vibrio variabilis TaxID=990271 RepID=A0ABQ0J6Z5_9VIBR|nr:ATP-binding protein PhnN [Vibrio variabilis]
MIDVLNLEASSDASFSSTPSSMPRMTNTKGKLYYIVGPSGAGKDTLIDAIRAEFPEDIIVAHRYITRPFGAGGENHIAISETEYFSRQTKGLFAMSWQAHGLCYGVGVEVKSWLNSGFSVVLNGSRAELNQAKQCFGEGLVPIVVNVSLEVLRERLESRGRESAQEIERRLKRATDFAIASQQGCHHIDNSGDIAHSVDQFRQVRSKLEEAKS